MVHLWPKYSSEFLCRLLVDTSDDNQIYTHKEYEEVTCPQCIAKLKEMGILK